MFAPPSRPLLAAASYADACSLVAQERLSDPDAKCVSAPAFGIGPKVGEADQCLSANPSAQTWLWECHPELSFRALAKVLPDKKSVAGQGPSQLPVVRFPALGDALEDLEAGWQAELADALDALIALDRALHVRAGDYEQLDGDPDARGLLMRMAF